MNEKAKNLKSIMEKNEQRQQIIQSWITSTFAKYSDDELPLIQYEVVKLSSQLKFADNDTEKEICDKLDKLTKQFPLPGENKKENFTRILWSLAELQQDLTRHSLTEFSERVSEISEELVKLVH